MAGRSTVYNSITSPEKLENCNKFNIELGNEFIDYLKSVDRAETTIKQYISDLNIFGFGIMSLIMIRSLLK